MSSVPVTSIPAEKLAQQMVRRALANATRPDPIGISDATGLSRSEVSQIIAAEKNPGPTPPTPVRGGPRNPAGESWRNAKDHPDRKVRDLHARAVAAVAALEDAIAKHERTTALLAQEADLLARLEQIRGEIAPDVTCHDCGRQFVNRHGLAVHWARKHEERP